MPAFRGRYGTIPPAADEYLTYETGKLIMNAFANVTNVLRETVMRDMRHLRVRCTVLLSMVILAALFFAAPVFAGWENPDGSNRTVTYTDDTGVKVTGLQTIGAAVYYFDEFGYLQTGWTSTPEGFRYFREDGEVGETFGSMIAGCIYEIDEKQFGFGEDGVVLAGCYQIGKYYYYFKDSSVIGTRGRVLTDVFKNLPDGRRSYFNEKGHMLFNKWVKNHKYYVDKTGNMLRNSVTPDGYVLKKNGKVKKKITGTQFVKIGKKWYFYKNKKGIIKDKIIKYKKEYYYVDEDGVRQTGWITIGNYDYYFQSDGTAATGIVTIDGESYKFNKKGRLKTSSDPIGTKKTTGKASILILCGHGQGDPGAVGCGGTYVESVYTRDFGKRIYEALQKKDNLNVTLFNTDYDMFQQMKATVTSRSSVTGSGKKKKTVLKQVKKNSKIPLPTLFDFVLEIHFNATAESAKDPGGNGSKKGTGTYVNSHKSTNNRKVDKAIISALNDCGLNTWGSGVYGSSDLLNARIYQEVGVNYTLLETCFIDDKDDMKFYLKKRDKMASNIANALSKYFE